MKKQKMIQLNIVKHWSREKRDTKKIKSDPIKYANRRKKANELERNKINTNIDFKLKKELSTQIREALKNDKITKNGNKTWVDIIIDYTPAGLEEHLTFYFEFWMTWNNNGVYNSETWDDNDPSTWTWNIDHIKPISHFNFANEDGTPNLEEIRKCWALENLRPYSAKLNVLEGNKRTEEEIKSIKENIRIKQKRLE